MACTKGLPRLPITPNVYQKSGQKERARRHLDELSIYLDRCIKKNNANHGHDFEVFSLTTTDHTDRLGGHEPKSGLQVISDNNDDKSVFEKEIFNDRGSEDNRDSPTNAVAGSANNSAQANRSPQYATNGPATVATVKVNDSYSCVDLKGMAKLKRLCCMLRKKVTELKITYEKRHSSGCTYTESEQAELGLGLQSLEDGTIRLLQTLNNIDGYRKEMKHVIDIYTDYESQYRKLRSMNKKAKSRYVGTKKSECNDGGTNFNFFTMLRDYIFCFSCFNV